MEIQTRLRRHNKFISAENITILSISPDDTDWIFNIYIYIYVCVSFVNGLLVGNILIKSELTYTHTVKRFQLLNTPIWHRVSALASTINRG